MPITQYNSSVRQMSQSKFDSMKNASGKIPDLANQIVMTNSEDTNTSCLRTKVLWTNPNPNISFEAQNITLSDGNYEYLEVILRATTGLNRQYSVKIKKGNGANFLTYYAVTWSPYNYDQFRTADYISDTEYSISDNYRRSTDKSDIGISNDQNIPIEIIGYYKTPSMIYTGDELTAGNGISIANGVISADNDANFVIYNLFSDAEKSVTSGAEIIYSVGKQLKKGKYYACVYGQVYMNTRMGFLQLTIDSQTNVVEAATNSVSRIGIYGSNIVTLDNDGEHAIYLKLTAQSNSTITLQGYSTYGFALFRIGD